MAGTGDEVFSGVVGGAATGVDWLREPPGAVLELVKKENIVEVLCPLLLVGEEVSTALNFSLRFTLTEEAEGAKDDFCAAGAVESNGPDELSAAGLKLMEPKGKEVAGAVVVLPTEAGVMDALEEAEEKENVASPVRAGVWACLEASVAKEYGGGSLPVEPGVFTAEGMKEKTAAPLPAGD